MTLRDRFPASRKWTPRRAAKTRLRERTLSCRAKKRIKYSLMERGLNLDILHQPDDHTCGPTCLHAVYQYFGDDVPLNQVVHETDFLEEGGTLAPLLGCHALRRGYQAKIYTWDLRVFDPTWFAPGATPGRKASKRRWSSKTCPRSW